MATTKVVRGRTIDLGPLIGQVDDDVIADALHQLALESGDTLSEFEEFLEHLKAGDGDMSSLFSRTHEPVSIQEFLEDPYFMNMPSEGDTLWPELRHMIIEVIEGGFVETLQIGAVGTGKTTAAQIITAYHLYLLSCEKYPQARFGLLPTSTIVIAMLNRTDELARTVTYGEFRRMIDDVPYFKERFSFQRHTASKMVFPRGCVVIPSAAYSNKLLGMNVIGGIVDEMNFMLKVHRSKQSVDGGEFDQAKNIYTTLVRRRKSRFLAAGKLPGCLCLVSSKGAPNDFTEQRLLQLQKEKLGELTYVWDKAQWDVVPSTRFTGEKFLLEVGDARHNSRVIDNRSEARDGANIIEIPIEFKNDFDNDMEGSLRDYAGIATLSARPFFWDRNKVWQCATRYEDRGYESPFVENIIDLSRGVPKLREGWRAPDQHKRRVMHVDIGLTRDRLGMACGYVDAIIPVRTRVAATGESIVENRPHIVYDFILSVTPPRGGEVDLSDIREIIYLLRTKGLDFQLVTFDGFQSRDSLQILRKQGIRAQLLSVDGKESVAAYTDLRGLMWHGRCDCPEHQICFVELCQLEHDKVRDIIDHPPNGSKDAADAMAGVAVTLLSKRSVYTAIDSHQRAITMRPSTGVRPATVRR